jgi:ribose transport system permease protein
MRAPGAADVVVHRREEDDPPRLTVRTKGVARLDARGGTLAPDTIASPPPPPQKRRRIPELTALVVFLVAEMIFFSVKSEFFLAWDNWLNIMVAVAVIGIMAAPGTLLLTAGQLDLSVGSIAAFTSVVTANLALHHNLTVAVIGGVLAGLAVGVVNGTLVTVFGVSALITTLGTLATFRGLTEVIADGETIIIEGFGTLGTSRPFLNIPVPALILVVVFAVFWALMRYTVFGRSMYAIGANPTAARLVGIRSQRYIFVAFLLSAACCALSGLILTSQLNVGSPVFGTGIELSVITAIVLGGASLSGGRGSVIGTAIGLLIIGVLNNGLTLTGVDPFWQNVARGTLLITAVVFDRLRARYEST